MDKSEVQLAEVETSRQPETMRKMNLSDIKVEYTANSPVKFRSEIKLNDKPSSETELKEADSPKPLAFSRRYCNAFRFYHRLSGMFFSIDGSVYRFVNVLSSFTQLAVYLVLACSSLLFKNSLAFYGVFVVMRLVQPLFAYAVNTIAKRR